MQVAVDKRNKSRSIYDLISILSYSNMFNKILSSN